ncbi:MAG: YitT family protein [Oscillospiraceae bacterium]|nr:YitT family protein [Oscillospiraceae bacterium]
MDKREKALVFIKEFLLVTVGSFIYAVGLSMFLDANNISAGGIAGLAMIVTYFTRIDLGLMIFLMNLPLFIAGWIRFRNKFLFYTIYAIALSSYIIDFLGNRFPQYMPLTRDLMLATIAGGAIMSVGMSMIYLGGGSVGGTDIIIKFLRQKHNHIGTGTLSFIMDFTTCVLSCFVFGGYELGIYAALALYVQGIVMDKMLYGSNEAKLIFIISTKTQEVSTRLLNDLGIGVTWLEGTGAYTEERRKVVFAAFRKQNYQRVRQIVKEEDPEAFMIVTSATEIFGLGFRDHFADEL